MVHYLVQSYIPRNNPNTQADVFANADVLCATVLVLLMHRWRHRLLRRHQNAEPTVDLVRLPNQNQVSQLNLDYLLLGTTTADVASSWIQSLGLGWEPAMTTSRRISSRSTASSLDFGREPAMPILWVLILDWERELWPCPNHYHHYKL